MNQKVLSILFTLLLLFSTLFTPITTFAAVSEKENNQNIQDLHEKEVNEEIRNDKEESTENEVNKGENDDDVKKGENKKDTDKANEERDSEEKTTNDSTYEQEDQKETKENDSEVKERAPPVTVDVRVETHEKTLVPTTELTVESFELMEYINGNNNSNSVFPDTPRAIHAIIQGLETVEDLDLKNDDDFGLGYGGNYISKVGKDSEPGSNGMAGWMYFIDNAYVDVGVLDRKLEGGESIVLYYTENFTDNTFSWFDQESYSTEVGESLELELTGVNNDVVDSVEGASILINEKEYKVDDEALYTDQGGKIDVVFDEPGTYHISANRQNDAGERNIVRPYAVVEVTEKEAEEEEKEEEEDIKDEVPPVITVEGLTDGDIVSENELSFTVNALDEVDGEINPTVEVNQDKIEGTDNQYVAELNKGDNVIVVSATDKAGNEASETYNITFEPENESTYNIDERIEETAQYMLSKGVNSEWEAIGLERAGISVPESYRDILYNNVESQVENALLLDRAKITDIERLTIAAVALGEDPRDINGLDLIDLIYNSPMRGVTDTMIMQGNNGPIFALIALNTNNYPEPTDSKWNREKLINELLNNQNADGSWSLNPSFESPSVDITAMAITGLAPYKDQSEVDEAINNAIGYLSKLQNEEGGFTESFVGGTSSEATSQAIIAITAYGMDPTDDMFTENGNNLIDHLLSYHNEDGGFSHLPGYDNSNGMASEQALQALVAYDYYLNDKGRLYEFDTQNEDEEIALDVAKAISALPEVDSITLEDKADVQKAREAYEQLTISQKSLVENVSILEAAEKRISDLEKEEPSKVDKSQLKQTIEEAEKIDLSNKTESTATALKDKITEAQSILDKDDVTQTEIDNILKEVEIAMENLQDKPTPVDKTKLEEKIEIANETDISDKTDKSVEVFQSALSAANWVIASQDVSQADVDKAIKNLEKAIDNLEIKVVLVEPNKETDVSAKETIKVNNSSISIKLPDDLPKNTKANIDVRKEIDDKDMEIAGDIVDIELIFDKEENQAFESKYTITLSVNDEYVGKNVGIYHFNEKTAKWEYVESTMNEDGTISAEVNHFSMYGVFLIDDEDGEEEPEKANKEDLQTLLEQAQTIDTKGKTKVSVKDLLGAIESGVSVVENEQSTQNEVDTAIKELEEAITNLQDKEASTPVSDTSELVDKTNSVEELDTKKYTKKSVDALEKAMLYAEKVLNNPDSTDEEIAEAIKLLDEALDELVKKTTSSQQQPNDLVDNTDETDSTLADDKVMKKAEHQIDRTANNLPETATSYYTFMLIGATLLLIAIAMVIVQRRKMRN